MSEHLTVSTADQPEPPTPELVTLDALRSPVWVFDLGGGRTLWANRSARALCGVEAMPPMPEEPRGRLAALAAAVADGGTLHESWTFAGRDRPVAVDCCCSGLPVKGQAALLVEGRVAPPPVPAPPSGVQDDAAERMRLQRELQKSEERLQLALDASEHGLWDWNIQTGALYISPRWQAKLGVDPAQPVRDAETWARRVHPDDLPMVRRVLQEHLDGLTPSYGCEHRLRSDDGSWLWILDRGRVVERDADGRPLRMVGTHADIATRKAAQADLADSRARLDAILDNAPVGIAIIGEGRRIQRANRAMSEIFQHPLERFENATTRILYADDAVYEEAGARAYPVLRGGGTFVDEFLMRRGDGTDIWCRLTGRSIHPEDLSLGVVWIFEDVTVRRRAEQALNDRLAFQRVLLDTVPVPIFVQDVSGYYVNANAAFEQWMGIDRQSLFGKTAIDLAPPDLAAAYDAADRDLLANGQTLTVETQVHCADGGVRDVVLSKAVYCRSGDKPAGIVGAMVDISERKRAEQALRERHALFEQIFVASRAVKLLIDPDSGLIVDANPAAAAFYGYSLDRLRSLRITDINALPPDAVAREMERARGEGSRYFLFRHRLASGELRDVEVYSSPVQVNGRTLLLSLVHDITERCRAEAALQGKTAELERSNAELEAFAYVASHDLRQPLRVINSYLGLLERALKDQLDEETAEFIAFARDGAQRMDRLIVDLLEYSRVGRKAKPFRPVPLGAAVDTALLNLEVAVADAGAAVHVDGPLPTVPGDENELVRLFQNLIGNAVKYRTPDRAPVVHISCQVARGAEDGAWVFTVRDNGIGIAPEHLERVFGIFQRLHRRDEYEGTGVGLAVCKKIVEHHGGRIWVESEEGQGSAFRFTLPRTDAPEAERRHADPS